MNSPPVYVFTALTLVLVPSCPRGVGATAPPTAAPAPGTASPIPWYVTVLVAGAVLFVLGLAIAHCCLRSIVEGWQDRLKLG